VTLKSIEVHGLKTADRSVELGRLTLIRGPVGAGKSALIEALQFLALGCVPRVGRSEEATALLMHGPEIAVSATLEDGRIVKRALRRVGRSLKNGAEASWMPPRAQAQEIGDAIRALFGASDGEAAENLDIGRLLAVSGKELARRIEIILDQGGLSSEQRTARGVDLWEARVDSQRETVDGLRQPLPPAVVAALEELREPLEQVLGQGIVPAIEATKAGKLGHADESRRAVQARAALEERIRALAAPAEALADLQRRRAAAHDRSTQLARDVERFQGAAQDRTTAQSAVASAAAQVGPAMAALGQAETAAQRIPQLREQAQAIADPPDVPAPAVASPNPDTIAHATKLDEEAAYLEGRARDLLAGMPPLVTADEAAWRLEGAEKALRLAGESPWREVERIVGTLDEAAAAYPSTVGAAVEALRTLAEKHGGDTTALEGAVTVARRAIEAAQEAAVASQKSRAVIQADVTALQTDAGARRAAALAARKVALGEAVTANEATTAAYRQAAAERRLIVEGNAATRTRLSAEATALERALTQAREAKTAADAALTAAQARLSGLSDALPIDVPAATQEITSLAATVADLDAKIALCRNADALREELLRVTKTVESATARRDVYAAAEWAFQRLRDEDMAQRAGGLEGRMRKFLQAAGRSEDPYIRCQGGAA
jgi:chromosome segregation ATPase